MPSTFPPPKLKTPYHTHIRMVRAEEQRYFLHLPSAPFFFCFVKGTGKKKPRLLAYSTGSNLSNNVRTLYLFTL